MAWRTGYWGSSQDARRGIRTPTGRRLWDLRVLGLLLFLTALVVASYVLHPLPSEVRWSLLVVLLIGVAVGVLGAVYHRTVRVPPLDPPAREDEGNPGELARLVQILRRADRGLPYSQGLIALRARDAFLALIRSEMGMEPEELEAHLEDPSKLRRLVRDPVLRAFLEDTAPEQDLLYDPSILRGGPLRPVEGSVGFRRRLERVLRAMEDWP